MKCDLCDALATVHFTEVFAGKGVKQERHLCEQCAARVHGLPTGQPSIRELLREFVEKHRPIEPEDPPDARKT